MADLVKPPAPFQQVSRLGYVWLITLPRVQPIISTWRKEPFDNPDWLFESKYDGFRALLYLENGKGRLIWGRHRTLCRFDPLCNQVATELDLNDAILDGEVMAADKTGRLLFDDSLRRTRRSPYYLVFDILCGRLRRQAQSA
jgi:bifunctional non-homologous end joining protein LigD